ncbi:ribbon-helix-helix domain-containing protein [Kribbella sp. NBC_01510]|uniref:ribbon-helix-helix domain-containing protein n=1 Tax=Kribbella sp. NBC_01510 TaxID=2903581 RepID=UPI00386D5BD9
MPRSVIATSAPPGTAPIRKLIVRVTIGSFSLAALLGIIALLRGGEFGQTQFRVLLTTLLVGVVSIAVLCYLATAGRPSQPVGVAGGVIVLVPLVTALLMIWGDVEHGPSEGIRKTFGIGTAVAATLAQASLLLTLGERARPGVRRILDGTLALAAVLAAMTSALIAGFTPAEGGYYHRILGVVAILDVLGTVVVAALMKFGSGDLERARADVRLPKDLAESVAELATKSGQSSDEVVAAAVRLYLRDAR